MSKHRDVVRPSGYKGSMKSDKYLTKDSQYGVVYFCTACGKKAIGTTFRNGRHHHYHWCPRYVEGDDN